MLLGILLGISLALFFSSLTIIFTGSSNMITAAVIGSSGKGSLIYPIVTLTISFIMIVVLIIALIKQQRG